jgi:hypothetical protein
MGRPRDDHPGAAAPETKEREMIRSACLTPRSLLMVALLVAHALPAGGALPARIVAVDCQFGPVSTEHIFAVENNSLPAICGFTVTPMDGPSSCVIIGATQPANWTSTLSPDGSVQWTVSGPPGACVPTGTTASGFSLAAPVLNQCCYYVDFQDESGASQYSTTFCCTCIDDPLSIESGSWGRVKALYR